ncbi:MAG: hypothetical protein HRU16_07445 [Planctomycetes bacterium]|nr:hypothetical protein [Planctomycetota bacterium]
MAGTQIADIVNPALFSPYSQQVTAEKSAFISSRVISNDAFLASFLQGGGTIATLPFWDDLDNTDSNVISDALIGVSDAVPLKTGTGTQLVIRQNRSQTWSAAALASDLAGSDALQSVANRVGNYWARDEQRRLIATVRGVMEDNIANDASDMVNDITVTGAGPVAANLFSAEAFMDTVQTMGDQGDRLTAVIMHSVVFTRAKKNDLIDFRPDSQASGTIPFYNGLRVIVDDTVPTLTPDTALEFSTYLFGEGAFAGAVGSFPDSVAFERQELAGQGGGQEFLIHRRQSCLHPRGFQFTSSSLAGASPTNAEMLLAANWDRVVERKLVPLAELRTNG